MAEAVVAANKIGQRPNRGESLEETEGEVFLVFTTNDTVQLRWLNGLDTTGYRVNRKIPYSSHKFCRYYPEVVDR